MKLYEIVFSPTGGTQKVADVLTKALGTGAIQIDLADARGDFGAYSFCPEDICVIAVPSYGGRVPAAAISRLGQLHGGQARAVLVCVYGNRAYEDTLLELKDTLLAAGFRCTAGVAAVAEHSIMRRFAAGRPDEVDALELRGFGEKIRAKLEVGNAEDDLALPGNTPYRQYSGVPMKPTAGKKCTKCGLCADRCPVGAIPVNAPNETDAAKCISCMRCVSICPNKARTVNRLMLTVGAHKMKKACMEPKKNELFL